jgi:hypothetical protein
MRMLTISLSQNVKTYSSTPSAAPKTPKRLFSGPIPGPVLHQINFGEALFVVQVSRAKVIYDSQRCLKGAKSLQKNGRPVPCPLDQQPILHVAKSGYIIDDERFQPLQCALFINHRHLPLLVLFASPCSKSPPKCSKYL